MAKGDRLTQYDKVYRELDATHIGAERQREVKLLKGEKRYDMYYDMAIANEDILTEEMRSLLTNENDCYIMVHSSIRDRLNFAERVAQHYGAKYFIFEEPWRSEPRERNRIYIKVSG